MTANINVIDEKKSLNKTEKSPVVSGSFDGLQNCKFHDPKSRDSCARV